MSIKMRDTIKEFHELCCPRHDDGEGDDKDWIVCDNDSMGYYYLLNDGSFAIANIINAGNSYNSTDIYFATELEAHHAAVKYYDSFGETYPHGVAMMAAAGTKPIDEFESQVMEFE